MSHRPGPAALALCCALAAGAASAQERPVRQAPFSLDERFAVLLDRIDELEASLAALRDERDALAASAAADPALPGRVAELEEQLAAATAREREVLGRLEERMRSLDRARAEAEEATAAREALAAGHERELDALGRERDRLAAELEAERERAVAETAAEGERAAAELDALRAELDRAVVERDDARVEIAIAEARAASLARRLAEADDEIARLGETLSAGERAADEVERRIVEMIEARGGTDGGPDGDGADDEAVGAADDVGGTTEPVAIAGAPTADAPTADTPAGASCEDALESRVEGIVATLVVTNPCRAGETLSVRAARALDPLIAQLRAGFDGAGRAELVFPVLEPESRLRVFGAGGDRWQDVVLSPEDGSDGDLAVLRWEDALVDLDLVLEPRTEGGEASAGDAADGAFGTRLLAQGTDADQLPRFEVFSIGPDAPSLSLGVAQAGLGEVAEAPFCGDADAAAPRVRVVLRDGGEIRLVREALEAVACGEPVPEARRVSRLRTLR